MKRITWKEFGSVVRKEMWRRLYREAIWLGAMAIRGQNVHPEWRRFFNRVRSGEITAENFSLADPNTAAVWRMI